MRLFAPLYDWTLRWAAHRRAPWALGGLSFAESIIFPVPTDVMLAPMVLSRPEHWLNYAALATITSILGGVFGYVLGAWAFDLTSAWLLTGDWAQTFEEVQHHFDRNGILYVFIAAFTPVPYKVVTVSAGFLSVPLLPFVLASTAGRAARFFLVAGLFRWLGAHHEDLLRKYIEPIGWALVAIIAAILVVREWL